MTAERMEFLDGRPVIDPAICNGKPTIRGKRITDGAIRCRWQDQSQAVHPEIPSVQLSSNSSLMRILPKRWRQD